MYIHELKNWPKFLWDHEVIARLLIELRHQQGRLIGGMESIGFHLREETVLQTLTQDVVKSSEIEGEILDQSLVRSSVARHLGIESAALNKVDRNIDGVVAMMLDATQNYDQPLTKERLLGWHASLFPMGRSGFTKIRVGQWRINPVEVVSGQMGKETIHFEGPAASRVEHEMELFLYWINNESLLDPVLKAALAHLWFVTIHPFDDGNGRIGRAIADLLLARSEKSPHRFYSLSAQIQIERKGYYAILEKTQKGTLNITPWVEWFFGCLGKAISNALSALDVILHKAQFWETLAEVSLNERQRKIINRLLYPNNLKNRFLTASALPQNLCLHSCLAYRQWSLAPDKNSEEPPCQTPDSSGCLGIDGFEGKLTSSKWAKITKCSQDTAYRDILDLVDRGILIKNSEGGRSTSYSLAALT